MPVLKLAKDLSGVEGFLMRRPNIQDGSVGGSGFESERQILPGRSSVKAMFPKMIVEEVCFIVICQTIPGIERIAHLLTPMRGSRRELSWMRANSLPAGLPFHRPRLEIVIGTLASPIC